MIDFLIGAAVILPLVFVNQTLITLMRRADAELSLAFAFGMFFLGLVVCLAWGFAMKTEVDSSVQMCAGVGMGIVVNTMYKINYIVKNPIK